MEEEKEQHIGLSGERQRTALINEGGGAGMRWGRVEDTEQEGQEIIITITIIIIIIMFFF